MKNKVKILLCITMLVIMAAFASACTEKDPYIDDEKDDSPLQIYLIYYDQFEIDAVNKYNNQITQENIDGRRIEITEFQIEEIENMYDRITSEMMAGKGPDIVFFGGAADTYIDLAKMSEQSSFADLDVLIEKSETFSFDDYNKAALDAGIINGKRVMMPISYKVNYIISTQENLDNTGVTLPEYLTYEEFFEITESIHNNTEKIASLYPSNQIFYDFITPEGIDEVGIEYLEKYIDFEIEDNRRFELIGSENISELYNGDLTMWYTRNTGTNTGEFDLLFHLFNQSENQYDKHFVMINEPSLGEESAYGYIISGCAINMNSKHKNDAFKFVEFLISEQCQYSNTLRSYTLPVNSAAYNNAKSDFENDNYTSFARDYPETPVPDEIKEQYIELVEGVDEYKYIGQQRYIYKFVINDIFEEFLDEKIDFETMIEQMNKKIELYYSE